MNAPAAFILTIIVLIVLFASSRWAFLAMMGAVLYLGQESSVSVLGFNLFSHRFVEIAGFVRVMVRGEFSISRLNRIDRTLLFLYTYTTIVFLLRSDVEQSYQIGLAVDAFLCYFAFRGLVDSFEDFTWFLRTFVFLLVPYTALVLIESRTGRNPFELVGSLSTSISRNGRIRCHGTFRHASLLGTLGGSFLPLYIGLWFVRNCRAIALFGITSCLVIVWASNSGAPVSLVGLGLIGWLLWSLRTKMYIVRRALTGMIVLLAMVMKAPVWYLLERVSELTGGDGWHRAHLLDMAFQDLGKWWLSGMSMAATASWSNVHFEGGGSDIADFYLIFALSAGMGALLLFILLLTRACTDLGKSMAKLRVDLDPESREKEFLFWGLGVVLAVHIFNWLGIVYFDQTYMIYFMQLAVISSLTEVVSRGKLPAIIPKTLSSVPKLRFQHVSRVQ